MEEEIKESTSNQFNKKKFAKNMLIVLASNVLLILCGLLTGFFVPKLLGVQDYGYFKTFSLYAGYVSIFQFGFINGIFLVYGGKNYDQLPLDKFRLYSRILFIIEGIATLIGLLVAFVFFKGIWTPIVIFLSIYSFSVNCMTYFQQISQITQNFKQYSKITLLQSVLKIVSLLLLWLAVFIWGDNQTPLIVYTVSYTFIFTAIFFVYLYLYRSIIFGKAAKLKDSKKNVIELFRVGFPLFLADFVIILIYACNRQVVSIFFSTEEFGFFAFACTITSLVTTAVAAFSTVLYPTLKRMSQESLLKNYSKMVAAVLITGFFLALCFFPVQWIISHFLPEYSEAIQILKILFPGVVITCTINIVIQNYYKTFYKNLLYLFISLGVLGVSIGLDVAAYYVFHRMDAIALVSTIIFFIWFIVAQLYFYKKHNIRIIRNIIYALAVCAFFYISVFSTSDLFTSILIYICGFAFTSVVVYAREIKSFLFGFYNKKLAKPNCTFEDKKAVENKKRRINYLFDHMRKNKRTYIMFMVAFSCLSFCTFFSGTFIFNNSYQSLSNEIISDRALQGNSISYGYISSNNHTDSMNGLKSSLAKEYLFGVDMRKTSACFFSSFSENDKSALTVYYSDTSKKINVPAITTIDATFKGSSEYYGFQLLDDVTFPEDPSENSLEVFITQPLADDIIESDPAIEEGQYYKLINYECLCDTSKSGLIGQKLKILGVISNESIGEFGSIHGYKFVLCQYNALLYHLYNSSLGFFLRGQASATTTFVTIIEKTAAAYDQGKYSVSYMNYGKNGGNYYLGNLQDIRNATFSFYSSTNRTIMIVISVTLSLASLAFAIRQSLKIVLMKDRTMSRFLSIACPLMVIFAFSIILVLMSTIGTIVVANIAIVWTGFETTTLAFCLTVIASLFFLFVYTIRANQNKNSKITNTLDYEVIFGTEIEEIEI